MTPQPRECAKVTLLSSSASPGWLTPDNFSHEKNRTNFLSLNLLNFLLFVVQLVTQISIMLGTHTVFSQLKKKMKKKKSATEIPSPPPTSGGGSCFPDLCPEGPYLSQSFPSSEGEAS